LLLLFVTLYAIIAALTHNYPLNITNPFKIIGNLASVMLFVGLGIFILIRLLNKKEVGNSSYSDWLLLVSIFLLTTSGVVVQIARFENWDLAYQFYFFHLVCVWFVIIYLPYTKFAHMIYRLIALSFANSIGRK
jgi:quinone-modifying oxidoreductase subunit QmoC